MSKNNLEILEVQDVFKIKLLNQLKSQNERYKHALKIIEQLTEENEQLKFNQPEKSHKKTKKSIKRKTVSKEKDNYNKNDFFKNIKVTNLFKKFDTALNNILEVITIINSKKYLEKISKFISKKSNSNNILLMESVKIIQDYIKLNMNVMEGILIDINHKPIFDLFNNILESKNIEENMKALKKLTKKNTDIKLNKTNSFKNDDISLLKNELEVNMERMNVNIDLYNYRFKYQDNQDKSQKISFNQILEKIKDCNEFIEKDNIFM